MRNLFSQVTRSDAVVITGASTGIGAACALALDKAGYRVFAGVRDPADGERLQRQAGPRLMPIRLDVTDPASISAASHTVTAMMGERGLAGLLNNAGIGVAGPVELLPLADWRRQFEVNVFGLIAVTQTFLPLIRQGRGRIINMGSVAGRAAMPFMAPYAASKHALEAITDALRLELQPWGIRVMLITPGAIATPIWKKTKKEADSWDAVCHQDLTGIYKEGVTRIKEAAIAAGEQAQPAAVVAEAVTRALRSRWPKTRYLVGSDAAIRIYLAMLLPDRLNDWLITRIIKLPPRR
ncbi:MAG: Oxidoreductase, Glucose/ribitol dehydrogenase family [Nitrospira sp.]|jgi:NAD(P)-dependent dehydrogenase (short-subunit alcohol dehydrogenase family)|nr:Oxidoreductase, Glucose/ribitol dehydrogenase family [Nitrospira sp.]